MRKFKKAKTTAVHYCSITKLAALLDDRRQPQKCEKSMRKFSHFIHQPRNHAVAW